MPTSTLDGFTFINFGPLTTTWTAAESCSTAIRNQAIAPTDYHQLAWWYERCDFDDLEGGPRYGDCFPSGEERDDYMRNQTDARSLLSFVDYRSPGLHCPASWTTAGIAVKDDSGSISATGVFSMTEFTVTIPDGTVEIEEFPTIRPWPNRMAHALDDGETAIVCCPSGYSVDPYGVCYSNFPFSSSTYCYPFYSEFDVEVSATFTYNDQVITGSEFSATGTAPEISFIETLILTDSDSPPNTVSAMNEERTAASLYTGHTQMPMVVLVQSGDDNNDSGSGDGDDSNAGSGDRAGLCASIVAIVAAWSLVGIVGAVLEASF